MLVAHRVVSLLAVVALCIVTNGCRLELALDLVVDRDGGGQVALTFTADEELRAAAAAAGVDPLTALVEEIDALPAWRARGGEGTAELVREFADPAELAQINRELVAALNLPEGRLLDELVVRIDEEERLIVAEAGLGLDPSEQAAADLGMAHDDLLAAMDGAVTAAVTVAMPAEVFEARATAADGRPVAVRVSGEAGGPQRVAAAVAPGERRHVRVVGEQPGLDPLVIPVAAAAAVALLATSVLFARVRRG